MIAAALAYLGYRPCALCGDRRWGLAGMAAHVAFQHFGEEEA